jgi:type IV secretion system protein VirB6
MIDACVIPPGPPSLARDVLASTDCFIATRVEQAYAQLLAPGGEFSGALTIALTLYVAFYGYRLVLGRSALTLAGLVPHFIRIGVVLALVTSWPSYQRLVFDLMFAGPQQIAGAVMARSGSGSAGNVVTSLQTLFDRMTDYAGEAWAQRPVASNAPPQATPPGQLPVTPDPATSAPTAPAAATGAAAAGLPVLGPPQFVAIAMWASALLMLASSIGLLLIARIILALLLMFGPVFVAMALFGATRGLFEGWLRVMVKFGLVPLIVLPLSAVLVTVLSRFVADLEPGPILAFRDTPALAMLMITLVFAIVLSQALSLTGTIARGLRLPRAAEPAPVAADQAAPGALPGPLPQPSRAEAIASLVPLAPAEGMGGSAPGTLVISSRRSEPAPPAPLDPTDYAGRLGQSVRRMPPRTGFAAGLRNAIPGP